MGLLMPESWRPVANVMPERRAMRQDLSLEGRRQEMMAWAVKWMRGRASRVSHS